MKYLIALIIPITVSATDMTTSVLVSQTDYGAWRFTNTSDQHLRCNMGLTTYPRRSTITKPKSPSLSDEPIRIYGTTGNRNFDLDPHGIFTYDRPNVGTVYCELNTQSR